MQRPNGPLVLNKIPISAWVSGTAEKMRLAETETLSDWSRFWLETYRQLGGKSGETGSKSCPRAAAYGLWFLGRLVSGQRPFRRWAVPQINRDLGKNAAYVVIAAELIEQGSTPDPDLLWPSVQARYKQLTGEEAAASDQGEIRLVAALYREQQLAVTPPKHA